MHKLAIAGVLVLTGAASAAAQSPWPTFTASPTITPPKAGTRAHPRDVRLGLTIHWQTLGSSGQPIVTAFHILLPKGARYNGAHVNACSLGALEANGLNACSRASIVGSGSARAYANTTITHLAITVVNGGAGRVYFYTALGAPGRVRVPVIGKLTSMGGNWSYRLDVSVPHVLQVVSGAPIELTYLSLSAGRGSWLQTVGCAGGQKWPFQVTTDYVDANTGATGSSITSGAVRCQR